MLSLGDIFLTPAKAELRVLPPAPKPATPDEKKRPAPFSIRLSQADRARLAVEAAGAPLGAYMKAKLLGEPIRARRTGLAIRDQQVLAQLVAHLGKSGALVTISELYELAQAGALPFTPETEDALLMALADITEMRRLLLRALGLMPEDQEVLPTAAALGDA